MQAPASTRSEMFSIIEDWKTSGLSQKAYCRQHNIRYYVFHYWYKVYRDQNEEQSNNTPAFVPLQIQKSLPSTSVMELVLPDGKRLLFHHEPSLDFLKALL